MALQNKRQEIKMIYIAYMATDTLRASQHEAGIMCRDSLFRAAGIKTEFAKKEGGRPYALCGGADYSVTHSKHLAACALITDKEIPKWDEKDINILTLPFSGTEIGLDAEFIDPDADTARLSRVYERFFATAVSSAEEFFNLWTRREAFGKLCGDGVLCKRSDSGCKYESFTVDLCSGSYRLCVCFR